MRTLLARFLKAGLVFTLLASPIMADDEPAPADDSPQLEGTWIVDSALEAGNQTDEPVGDEATFTADMLTIKTKDGDGPPAMKFTVDEKTTPKQIDLTMGERKILGVYSIEADRLHLCMAQPGEPRPEKLTSQPRTKQFSLVFGRKPAAAPAEDATEDGEE